MLERIENRIKNLTQKERRKVFEASFELQADQPILYQEWMDIIQEIPQRDKIKIFLEAEAEESYTMIKESREAEYEAFIQGIPEDGEISAKLEIQKSVENHSFSIYDFQKFAGDFQSMDLADALKAFTLLMKEAGSYLRFEMFDNSDLFFTKTMFFLPSGRAMPQISFDRRQRLDECREASYFYNQETYELIPDDFKIEIGYEGNPMENLFSKLETLLSLCYLASNSMLQNGKIKFQIIGQRSVEYTYQFHEICENSIFYKIYDWMHSGGNLIDKTMIARNMICLHCKYELPFDLDEGALASIRSNYNLYLKDNVTQYLELKNKVAEFISDIVSRTGEYATELLERFKTNLVAVFGFLFTVIMADVVSDQPLDNIFTRDITVILELVIAGSAVYLFICYKQSKYHMQKVYESYKTLKKSYQGILEPEVINECFQNDEILLEMQENIRKSERFYFTLWILFLIILLVVIENISAAPVIWPVAEGFFSGWFS